jgi:FkbM family methyltransferase
MSRNTASTWIDARLAEAPPGLFVDIGANVGWHTLHAARHPSVDAVVAFEPDLFNAYLLDRNLCANCIDKVVVSTCAIGARPRIARLYRYKNSNLGRHSLLKDYGRGFRVVPQLDLDTALDELGFGEAPVSVLKIDVEGGEPEVIAGARRTLERTDVVVHEFSPSAQRRRRPLRERHAGPSRSGRFSPSHLRGRTRSGQDTDRGAREVAGADRRRVDQAAVARALFDCR